MARRYLDPLALLPPLRTPALSVSDALAQAVLDALDDDALEQLAERLAPRIASRVAGQPGDAEDGYMAPDAAARYLGVKRKRIYDLTSSRALEPDGRDGRTPLFTRATLDAYARLQA